MFSSQLLTTPQRSAELGRNLVSQSYYRARFIITKAASNLTVEATAGPNPDFGFEHGGQSDRETPEPIPNSEDKPVHVPYCTQVREPSGNMDRCPAHLTLFFSLVYVKRSRITIITNCRTRNFGFTNPSNHAASRPTGARALRIAADIIPGRNQGCWITASTNPCDHAYLAQECPPWPRGQGGRPALRTASILSRAKTGSARGVPRSRAFCAVLRRASQLETTATIPSGIQGTAITTITNLN